MTHSAIDVRHVEEHTLGLDNFPSSPSRSESHCPPFPGHQRPETQWKDPQETVCTKLGACLGFLGRTVLDERWEFSVISDIQGVYVGDGVGMRWGGKVSKSNG